MYGVAFEKTASKNLQTREELYHGVCSTNKGTQWNYLKDNTFLVGVFFLWYYLSYNFLFIFCSVIEYALKFFNYNCGDECSKVLCNLSNSLPINMVSCPKRLELQSTSLWKRQILHLESSWGIYQSWFLAYTEFKISFHLKIAVF